MLGDVGALGQVLSDQTVDASMSSSEMVLSDLVIPASAIREHRPVDDVDQMALENPSSSTSPLGRFVFSLVGRCHSECGSAKNTGKPNRAGPPA